MHKQYATKTAMQKTYCTHAKMLVHLAKEDNLRIKPSNIRNAGKGLFAWKTRIPQNKFIAKYTGRHMTRQEIDRKYGHMLAQYGLCDNEGNCVDANYTTDDAARFANDHRGSIYRENAHYKGRRHRFYLKSARCIPSHHEIFASYGNEYWNRGRK